MKKFLIFVIILIPIIVVLALSATSTILSLVTPDNPTGIMIRDSLNLEVGRDTIISLDIKNYSEFIMVDILPLMTKEDGINTPEFDDNNTGEIALEHVPNTNKYKIIPVKVGIATVILSAKANVNIRRSITFNVKSETIESLGVYAKSFEYAQEGQERVEKITEIGENEYFAIDGEGEAQLYVDIYPIDALMDYQVYWKVVNGDAVSVTSNGRLEVKGRGVTQVRVSARDKNMNYITSDVIVDTRDSIVTSGVVITMKENMNLAWLEDNVLLDKENSVVEETHESEFKVIYTHPESGEEKIVYVHLKGAEVKEWDFVDKFETVYTNNGPYFLSAKNLADGKIIEDIVYKSSNNKIIAIDEKVKSIVPQRVGTAIVYAEYNGITKGMEMVVRERVPTFALEYGTEHAKLGIQLTRKWGSYFLNDQNEIINTFEFGLLNKSNSFDVIWESSDPSAVSIERKADSQDIVLSFEPGSEGKSATVTAYLDVNGRKYNSVKNSFTFNMLDNPDYVNVYNFEEIFFLSIKEEYNICLQDNIFAPETVNYFIGVSFYGNGFMYDSSLVKDEDYNYLFIGAINVFPSYWNWEGSGLRVPEGKEIWDSRYEERPLTYEEIIFQNAKTLEESAYRGAGVFIYGRYSEALITFRYVQAKNSEYGLAVKRGKHILVDGCILGDNATYSLYTEWQNEREMTNEYANPSQPPTMTIRNCVFKHSDGPAINFVYNSAVTPDEVKINYLPEIYIEGFLDVYNWHTQDSFNDMFSKIIIRALAGNFGMDEQTQLTMRKMLSSAFADYFRAPALSDLYYMHNNKKYVSVALLGMGAIFNPNIEKVHCEDPRLRVDQVVMADKDGKPLTSFLSGLEMIVKRFLDVETILNPSTFVVYDSVGRNPAIMPGQPVPQSYELYARLTGLSKDQYI